MGAGESSRPTVTNRKSPFIFIDPSQKTDEALLQSFNSNDKNYTLLPRTEVWWQHFLPSSVIRLNFCLNGKRGGTPKKMKPTEKVKLHTDKSKMRHFGLVKRMVSQIMVRV